MLKTRSLPNRPSWIAAAVGAPIAISTGVLAQPVVSTTVVFQEGQPIPGLPHPVNQDGAVLSLRAVRSDGQTGFAVLGDCRLAGTWTDVEVVWGLAGTRSVPGILWLPLRQTMPELQAWAGESEVGFAVGRKGELVFSQRMFRGACGESTVETDILDSVWLHSPPPPEEPEATTLALALGTETAPAGVGQSGWSWHSMSQVAVGGGGLDSQASSFWTGVIRHETAGAKGGLWKNNGSKSIVLLGDVSYTGLPAPLATTQPVRSFAVAMDGGNHLEVVALAHGEDPQISAANDLWLLRNKLPVGGATPIATGAEVAATDALPGEVWRELVALGVGTGGNPPIAYRGRTSAPPNQDEVLVRNSVIVLREGTTIDSTLIEGPIQCAAANGSGDILAVWKDVVTLNDLVLLRRGDTIEVESWELDGQGVPLPARTGTIRNFLGPFAAALSSRKGDSSISLHVIASLELPTRSEPPETDASLSGDGRVQALIRVNVENFGPASCLADFDGDDAVTVPDIFAFLSAWFASDPAADFDGNGVIAVPDIFAFLSAWFAGCV